MKTSELKSVITLTKKFINSNYFFDVESIQTQINNRDHAKQCGQDVSMYPDQLIKRYCLRNSLRKSVKHTAVPLYDAIISKDKSYLTDHIRYDQRYTKELFELFTGLMVPKSNYQIKEFINSNF